MITMMAVPFPVNRNTVPEPEENPPGVPDPEIIERRTGVIKKIRNSVKLFELVSICFILRVIFISASDKHDATGSPVYHTLNPGG